jgi:hypothetical protein
MQTPEPGDLAPNSQGDPTGTTSLPAPSATDSRDAWTKTADRWDARLGRIEAALDGLKPAE